jgi:hypothetical protein
MVEVRAAMLFGRCFEQAVAALFRHEDPAAALFEQWAPCKNLELAYSGNESLRVIARSCTWVGKHKNTTSNTAATMPRS